MLAGLVSGLLLAFSFPNPVAKDLKGSGACFAFFALVPLFLALKKDSPPRAFKQGLLSGLVFFGLGLSWFTGVRQMGLLAWPYWALLVGLLALLLGGFAAAVAWGLKRGLPWPALWVPALWTLMEALRSSDAFPAPWLSLGSSQFRNSWLLPVAAAAGIHGVHFLVAAVNWLLADGLRPLAGRRSWLLQGLAVGLLFVALRWAGSSAPPAPRGSVKVAVLQGAIGPDRGWGPEQRLLVMRTYTALMQRAVAQGATLLLWPETSFPAYFADNGTGAQFLREFARRNQVELVIGGPGRDLAGYANSAFLLEPDGSQQEYRKVRLIPFAEGLPTSLRAWPVFKTSVTGIARLDCVAGPGPQVLHAPAGAYGPLICFEACFPALARQEARLGAGVFLQLTSDDWEQDTAEAYQHLAQNVFRCAEEGRWMARAALTGVSCFIGPDGQIRDAIPLHQAGVSVRALPLLDLKTPYQRWGDWFLAACLGMALIAWFKKKRP